MGASEMSSRTNTTGSSLSRTLVHTPVGVVPVVSRRTVRDDTFRDFTTRTDADIDELFRRLKNLDRKMAKIGDRLGDSHLKGDDTRDRLKRDVSRIWDDLEALRNAIGGQLPPAQAAAQGAAQAAALPPLKRENLDPNALQELQQSVVKNTTQLDKHRRRLKELTEDHNRHIGILKGKVKDLDAKLRALAELTQTISGDHVSA